MSSNNAIKRMEWGCVLPEKQNQCGSRPNLRVATAYREPLEIEMNLRLILISILVVFVVCGCAIQVGKSARTGTDTEGNKEIHIEIQKRSYLDPDGFSRIYKPYVYYKIYKNPELEQGIFTFNLNKEFYVGYEGQCEGPGVLVLDPDKQTLKVKINGSNYPCGHFNGTYQLTKEDVFFLKN